MTLAVVRSLRRRWRLGIFGLLAGLIGLAALAHGDRSDPWPVERTTAGTANLREFGSDGRSLVAEAPTGQAVRVINLVTGSEQLVADHEWGVVSQVSPNGRLGLKRFNSPQSNSSELRIRDVATGVEVHWLTVQPPRFNCQFAPTAALS